MRENLIGLTILKALFIQFYSEQNRCDYRFCVYFSKDKVRCSIDSVVFLFPLCLDSGDFRYFTTNFFEKHEKFL